MKSFLFLICAICICARVTSQISFVQFGSGTVKPSAILDLGCAVSGASLTDKTKIWSVQWVTQPLDRGLQWLGGIWHDGSTHYAQSVQGRVTVSRDTNKGEVYLKFTGMKPENNGLYYCATDYFEYWGQGTQVTVSSASEQAPSLFPLISCGESKDPVIIGCLAKDFFPASVSFNWKDESNSSINSGFKNFKPVSRTVSGDQSYASASSQLQVTSDSWNQNKPFYCEATHKSNIKSVKLQKRETVVKAPIVSINPPLQESTTVNGDVIIVCVLNGFSPNVIEVRWLKNHNNSIESTIGEPVADKNGSFRATTFISVPQSEWDRNSIFSCEVKHPASNFYEMKNTSKSEVCITQSSAIQVVAIPPSFESIFNDKKVKLTCRVSNMPSPDGLVSIKWFQKGNPDKPLDTKQEDGDYAGGYIVNGVAEVCADEWNTEKFECKVKHNELAELKVVPLYKTNGGDLMTPEVFVYPPQQDELSQKETATVTCLVKGFNPKDAFVKWTYMEDPLDSHMYINTEAIKETSSTGKTTHFIYSKLTLPAKDWTDGKSYTCVVGHESLPLQLIQKTIDKYTGKPTSVNVSLVMSDTC